MSMRSGKVTIAVVLVLLAGCNCVAAEEAASVQAQMGSQTTNGVVAHPAASPGVDALKPSKKKTNPPDTPSGPVVPEPSALLVLACGMVGIGGLIQRRRRA